MFTAKGCFEMTLFKEWSNQVFDSQESRKYISYLDHLFFLKCLNFDGDSINGTKNRENVFHFQDNYCISTGNSKLSQSETAYLARASNVLRHFPKICYSNKGEILQIIFP